MTMAPSKPGQNRYWVLDDSNVPRLAESIMDYALRFDSYKHVVGRSAVSLPAVSVEVSTTFVGVEMGTAENGPLLFETAVFGTRHGEHSPSVEIWKRYATWDEAKAGHAEAVKAMEGLNP